MLGVEKYQLAATNAANWGENHLWVLNLLGGSLTRNGVTAWFQGRKDKTQRKPVSFSLENLLHTTYIRLIKVSITSHGQIPYSTWRERSFVWVLPGMHNLDLLTECQTMERRVQNGLYASKMVRWWGDERWWPRNCSWLKAWQQLNVTVVLDWTLGQEKYRDCSYKVYFDITEKSSVRSVD